MVMTAPCRAGLFALTLFASACADRGRAADIVGQRYVPSSLAPGTEGRGVDSPLVIVTLDGVRWQEVFGGTDPAWTSTPSAPPAAFAPNLYKLGTQRGAFVGAPGYGIIAASGPNFISLPGYIEILGGRPSVACATNDCRRTALPTLLDEARATGAKVAAFASWERLDYATTATPGAFKVSCGRQGDRSIDPWPGYDDYRPDAVTSKLALSYFEAEQPDVFFLGLGDPDEFAHRGDYARYVASIRQADQTIGRLLEILDRSGERGRKTHIVITADHGRARDFREHGAMPEAARVWLVAAGPRFTARGSVPSKRERHLADVAPTLRVVLGLTPDPSARAGNVLDELFEPDGRALSAL
jgi:hypothetical protein